MTRRGFMFSLAVAVGALAARFRPEDMPVDRVSPAPTGVFSRHYVGVGTRLVNPAYYKRVITRS